MSTIPNPPAVADGYIAKWTGSEWSIVPLADSITAPYPEGLPSGYSATWVNSEWVIVTPPAPSPDQITAQTINKAVASLQTIAYLSTSEMGQHITPESRQEVTDYIHAVANILATAQTKYGTGESYAPTFPPMPTAMPQLGAADDLQTPYIKFVMVN